MTDSAGKQIYARMELWDDTPTGLEAGIGDAWFTLAQVDPSGVMVIQPVDDATSDALDIRRMAAMDADDWPGKW